MKNRWALLMLLVLVGCSGVPTKVSKPNLRLLQQGDAWNFKKVPELDWQETYRYEIVTASAPNLQGVRSLVLRITHRYWGGLPGYQKDWQTRSCDYSLQQSATGAVQWGDAVSDGRGYLDGVITSFPLMVPSPLVAGQTFDSGAKSWGTGNGTERQTARVVGQEQISTRLGNFKAWRIDSERTLTKDSGKVALIERWTDWYDSDKWLLKRTYQADAPDDKLVHTLSTFVGQMGLQQVK